MRRLAPALLSLLMLTACESRDDGTSADDRSARKADDADDDADDDDSDDKRRSPLGKLLDNPLAGIMLAKLDEPGRFDPPKQSPDFDPAAPHLRVIQLRGSVSEVEVLSPIAAATGAGGSVQTRALLDTLDELADPATPEDRGPVAGLVLRVGELSLDMARASELRAALLAFKTEGLDSGAAPRELYCHAERLSNASYYLLSACDELALVPVGNLVLPGPAATPIHVAGLLDKLGVEAQMLHVGAFKGAAEPLTREAPSPEMIETLEAVVGRAHATMVAGIAAGREQEPETVAAWIDEAMFDAEVAAERGLVDAVEPWEPFLARVSDSRGWKRQRLQDPPWANPSALESFLGLDLGGPSKAPHVALIYAVGTILDGEGSGALGARSEIASAQLVPVLDRLAKDDAVAAVVMRVDSGGGSARASEQIWHAVERLRARKPVVVSMAGTAASGGYYIAAGASHIFADANTLTGSIGVVGGKIVIGPALEQLGVRSYAVAKGERALMWSPMQAWTETEQAAVQASMERTYEVFLARVAAGRELTRDAVHEVAQGRVWTGADALERGLVDELGGLEAALAKAYALAELDPAGEDTGPLEVYPGKPTIKDLLGSFEQLVVAPTAELPAPLATLVDGLGASVGPGGARWIADLRRVLTTLTQLSSAEVWAIEWLGPL